MSQGLAFVPWDGENAQRLCRALATGPRVSNPRDFGKDRLTTKWAQVLWLTFPEDPPEPPQPAGPACPGSGQEDTSCPGPGGRQGAEEESPSPLPQGSFQGPPRAALCSQPGC